MNKIKKCPVCLAEFNGRRNQIYCSIKCKSDFNNEKALKLRTELVDSKLMQNNYKILKELYEIYGESNKIDINEFYTRRFNFKCPSRKVKSFKFGYEFYIIHSYAFRIINQQNKQYIAINSKEEIINF